MKLKLFTKNGIEYIDINSSIMGGHADHWQAVCQNPAERVPAWLHDMLDVAVMPKGMHETHDTLPKDIMLLATEHLMHPCQVLTLDAEQNPSALLNTFPTVDSPYGVNCTIERIAQNPKTLEAVLRLKTDDDITLFAYDALYAINKEVYAGGTTYAAALSGIAHSVSIVEAGDSTLTLTDEDAIKHHRALNDILAQHDGKLPANFQELIAAWQPDNDEALEPVTLNLASMCAYLFGDTFGQEDEAWVQGEVLGLQKVTILGESLQVLDVAVLKEEDAQPIVVRMVSHTQNTPKELQVGDFIRSNLWLQVKIYAKKS